MKIETFKSNFYPTKPSVAKENFKTEEQMQRNSDSIEISSKAQELSKSFDGAKNLDVIRDKVNQGFYNSNEVLSKVADAILAELNSK